MSRTTISTIESAGTAFDVNEQIKKLAGERVPKRYAALGCLAPSLDVFLNAQAVLVMGSLSPRELDSDVGFSLLE
jgi:hypothetical protein